MSANSDYKPIYLTGIMGTGKSAVGKLLADRLGYFYYDLDELIVMKYGKTISNIFREEGESIFRTIESAALADLQDLQKTVVATGGGAVISKENRELMRSKGVIVYLTADVEILCNRLSGDTLRPLLEGENHRAKLSDLFESRKQFYADHDYMIDTSSLTPANVADKILLWLKVRGGHGV